MYSAGQKFTCTDVQIKCSMYVRVLMQERSKQGQTNNKAKQHSTPKVVTFPKKNELPRVHVHVNERCRRKEERSKQGHANNEATQHTQGSHFSNLPRVGLELTTLHNMYI